MTSHDNLHEIDIDNLRTVCGGQISTFPLPLQVPQPVLLPAPTKPSPTTPAPIAPPSTMAPPKYSAGWWDIFRRAGLGR